MADYRIVKFCRRCRKKFIVNKGESRKYYCDACQDIYEKERKEK